MNVVPLAGATLTENLDRAGNDPVPFPIRDGHANAAFDQDGGAKPRWVALRYCPLKLVKKVEKGLPAVAQQSTPGCRQAANEPGGAGTRWARVCCQQQSRVPGTSLRF
jgi:hypothetical protein